MKIKFPAIVLALLLYTNVSVFSQEICQVLNAKISGTYTGDCKKGKANGNGKSEGVDIYEGNFKDGLPHGEGLYVWNNGNQYNGRWVNGKRDGNGSMTFKREGKADSIVTGFWKKDSFIGKYEKAFAIHNRTVQVSKTDIKFTKSAINEITVSVSNTTAGVPTLLGMNGKVVLSDVSILKGNYIKMAVVYETNKQIVYRLEQVVYPFRAKFKLGNQEVDAEFFEEGKYNLDIALNN